MIATRKLKYDAPVVCIPPNIRFVLKSKNKGNNPLFIIGLNPSTANETAPDKTVDKIIKIAKRYGYDSFVMFNLYPSRGGDVCELKDTIEDELLDENIDHIREEFIDVKSPTIWACWGGQWRKNELLKPFFQKSLHELFVLTKDKEVKWLSAGETEDGDPSHPSPRFKKIEPDDVVLSKWEGVVAYFEKYGQSAE